MLKYSQWIANLSLSIESFFRKGVTDMESISVGIDIGSTAVKVVALSAEGRLMYSAYVPHHYRVRETLKILWRQLMAKVREAALHLTFTGKGAAEFSSALQVPFVDEVQAETEALRQLYPEVDVAVSLGGENARMMYFERNGEMDLRTNRKCAGGTGTFLAHMAAFFGVDIQALNALAENGAPLYPIASRCGVYAKTDIQALMNQGAGKADLAASIFQAVVNQALSDLAKGRPIQGKLALLGGPLAFMPALRHGFLQIIGISSTDVLPVTHGELYCAWGAALLGREAAPAAWNDVKRLWERGYSKETTVERLEPLFQDTAAYSSFRRYYERFKLPRSSMPQPPARLWLGMDAGSTTIKLVLVDEEGRICYEDYRKNEADALETARTMLLAMYAALPAGISIAASGITGYGEAFLKQAFQIDTGEVETVAHLEGARFFCPEVTDLLDIGGQDMKYIRVSEGKIQKIVLNGSCASGCGLFLETFADSMGLSMDEFVEKAVHAPYCLDLGHHCTVLMNSKVHQMQNENVDTGGLISGLCLSVVKNALFRVMRLDSIEELGSHIVVEGGTFQNDAVLRAFERLVGHPVVRPNGSGIMGAYGMALLTKKRMPRAARSKMLSADEIRKLTVREESSHCPGCGNHCLLQKKTFSNGHGFIVGNRCSYGERLLAKKHFIFRKVPNLYEWEKNQLLQSSKVNPSAEKTMGIPAVLGRWEDMIYWKVFWQTLGYRVIFSAFDAASLGKSTVTMPHGIYCYPCRLAHGHLMYFLEPCKPDCIWMPMISGGKEEPDIDEATHVSYGDVLAEQMKEQISAAGIPFYHPQISFHDHQPLISFMKENLPEVTSDALRRATAAAEKAQRDYKVHLRKKTRDALEWIEREKKNALVLVGRSYHLDPEINKGIPAVMAGLGIPVLSAEGLYLLQHEGDDTPTFREKALLTAEMVCTNPYLHFVQLQSTSCGWDMTMIDALQEKLERAGKRYTMISLDQGVSTGALQIRIRSLMAEIQEKQSLLYQ